MNWIQHLTAAPPPDTVTERGAELPRLDELVLTELVLPEQANHYGTLFGPNALALLGKAAFLVATRYTRQSIVMAAAKAIEFVQPVPVGAVLKIHSRVVRTGRSSLTARVIACFDTAPGVRADEVLRGDFEMVAVDAQGRPTPLTPVQPALPLHLAATTLLAAEGKPAVPAR